MSYSDLDGNYPGDAYAAADPPPYPTEWTAEQRVGAYWYTLNRGIKVRSTAHWKSILADAARTSQRHLEIIPAAQERP